MINWKKNAILILFFFLILPVIIIPASRGEPINLWGTTIGTTRQYTYNDIYTGSINAVTESREYSFSVLNIWDNDGNNYTELLLSQQIAITGISNVDTRTLDDLGDEWDEQSFLIEFDNFWPLLPIKYYPDEDNGFGLDWASKLQQDINTTLNYTVTIQGNVVSIHHWTSGMDMMRGAYRVTHEYIKWDNATGWLISYNQTINYGSPLNYIEKVYVGLKSTGGAGIVIDFNLLMGIIGMVLSGIGISLGAIALKKSRR